MTASNPGSTIPDDASVVCLFNPFRGATSAGSLPACVRPTRAWRQRTSIRLYMLQPDGRSS